MPALLAFVTVGMTASTSAEVPAAASRLKAGMACAVAYRGSRPSIIATITRWRVVMRPLPPAAREPDDVLAAVGSGVVTYIILASGRKRTPRPTLPVGHRADAAEHRGQSESTTKLGGMSADLDALVALMPFAGQLGLVLDEASADRVIARLAWAPHLCTSGGGAAASRPDHGDRPDQPVRLRAAPGRPDHADPGRPGGGGLNKPSGWRPHKRSALRTILPT